jgi:tRNA (guanine-N(7)-)-methyltransferase subunit TRM82
MPKRPSAITITADNETILSADKFGDVFSLPLLVTQRPRNGVTEEKGAQSTPPTGRSAKPAAPAANDLTVHTLRNRKALEHQLRGDQTAPSRAEPDFELKLLFGHVSMLTDVTAVERNGRGYIISADRDEHIRVSRGEPQAHIIEGFCLGHRSFISKLCVPVTASHILLSGGGDDEIFVWNWLTGIVLQKVSLRHDVEAVMADTVLPTPHASDSTGTAPSLQHAIAVANIQHVARTSNQPRDTIIVTCEGYVPLDREEWLYADPLLVAQPSLCTA